METIKLFVGYDPKEPIAYSVFCNSVISRTKSSVSFTPVTGEQRDGSNRFIYERFLTAYRCGFKGWAIFADGDMICLSDIKELWDLKDQSCDVMVVKHEYSTKHPIKYLGQVNEDYPRKNWSSVMLINCGNYPWRKITPEYVAKSSGKHLHRFEFLKDERIGDLPAEWNWLVGETEKPNPVKLAHYTVGLPCWDQYKDWPLASEWNEELKKAIYFYQPNKSSR